MRVDLILLVLNEIEGLRVILPQIDRSLFARVIAVDGGSKDRSVEFLESHGIPVVNQSRRGRGQAFAIGVEHSDADAFVFFSPDGNEDPADLPRIKGLLLEGADLVIASRMMQGAVNEEDSQFFKPRRWANNAFNLILNLVFNPHPMKNFITDSINGYRGLRRTLLPVIRPFPDDYTVEYRMTARALSASRRIVEFPTRENPRVGGESKVSSIPAGLRFLRAISEEIWHKLAGGRSREKLKRAH